MRNFENLIIAVAGTGYVGLSIATLLAQHHSIQVPVTENESCTECKQNMNKRDRLRIKYIMTLQQHVYENGLNTKISSAARWLLGE